MPSGSEGQPAVGLPCAATRRRLRRGSACCEGAKAALRPAKSSAGGSRGIWCQQEAPQKKKQGILASRVERPTLQDDIGRESPSRENRN
jgi:hypothetical protein